MRLRTWSEWVAKSLKCLRKAYAHPESQQDEEKRNTRENCGWVWTYYAHRYRLSSDSSRSLPRPPSPIQAPITNSFHQSHLLIYKSNGDLGPCPASEPAMDVDGVLSSHGLSPCSSDMSSPLLSVSSEPQSGYLKSISWPWTTGLFPSRAYAIVPAFRS